MGESRSTSGDREGDDVESARSRWLLAREQASKLAAEFFQPGSGYGDPEARCADEHRLQTAREERELLFREYYELDRQQIESNMRKLQRSQTVAAWVSIGVAAVIGVVALFK